MKVLFYYLICIMFAPLPLLNAQKVETPVIMNESPKFGNLDFLSLEKIFSIDLNKYEKYEINSIWSMDVDNDTNLYILDPFVCTISIFNNSGKFIKTIGGIGQGPREFEHPSSLSIHRNKIYVYENYKGLKIIDLNGEYIDFLLHVNHNTVECDFINNYFVTTETLIPDLDLTKKAQTLNRYNIDFEFINNIASLNLNHYKTPPFQPHMYIAVNSEFEYYFPQSYNKYIINKYNAEGELLSSFGRNYERVQYSKQANEISNRITSKLSPSITSEKTKFPPVVRYIAIDDLDNVWVAVGEWFYDRNQEIAFSSTIDIFDKNGKFLYTFESPYLGAESFIKNGQLYSTPTEDNRVVHVFKIQYNY